MCRDQTKKLSCHFSSQISSTLWYKSFDYMSKMDSTWNVKICKKMLSFISRLRRKGRELGLKISFTNKTLNFFGPVLASFSNETHLRESFTLFVIQLKRLLRGGGRVGRVKNWYQKSSKKRCVEKSHKVDWSLSGLLCTSDKSDLSVRTRDIRVSTKMGCSLVRRWDQFWSDQSLRLQETTTGLGHVDTMNTLDIPKGKKNKGSTSSGWVDRPRDLSWPSWDHLGELFFF